MDSGLMTTMPAVVGNHRRPSAVRQSDGCMPPEHWSEGMPSPKPYTRQSTALILPSAQSLSCCCGTRKIPLLELIQKFPRSSSAMPLTELLGSPSAEFIFEKCPFFN